MADTITTPTLRTSEPDNFRHLLHDVWAMEDEPVPMVELTREEHERQVDEYRIEASLEGNPLYRSLVFAPDYKAEDEIEYLVDGIVPFGSITAVAALFKVGKSEFVSSLVRSVSTGKQFLGRETAKSDVLYFAIKRGMSSTMRGKTLVRQRRTSLSG